MPLLIMSRIVHGYTILLFPLSVVWIGARETVEQRASSLASRNACAPHAAHPNRTRLLWPPRSSVHSVTANPSLVPPARLLYHADSTTGIFMGIVSGATLAAVLPTSLLAGAAPGYLNIAVSAVMLCWLRASFSDRSMIPGTSKKGGGAAADSAPWLHVILVGFAQFFGWVGFVAIEASLSLIVVREYGFTHQNVVIAWGPTSAAMLGGTFLFSHLHKAKCAPHLITLVAISTLPIGLFSLYSDYARGLATESRYVYSESYLSIGSTPPPTATSTNTTALHLTWSNPPQPDK